MARAARWAVNRALDVDILMAWSPASRITQRFKDHQWLKLCLDAALLGKTKTCVGFVDLRARAL
eukprot:5497073-Pyramimonas_sp.AAC.1